jgi:hypothetical protein
MSDNEPSRATFSQPGPVTQRERKMRDLESLRRQVEQLERELEEDDATDWRAGRYAAYYATTGFLLGMVGAAISLLVNIVGSLIWSQVSGRPQSPLKLIQVYLTFPLGEAALSIDNGLVLAIGCCLYLATGMVYGVLFNLALSQWTSNASFLSRIGLVSGLSIAIWLINFYGVLSWLQPLLFGGNWIVQEVPWWVAAVTHLVFGWSMVVLYPFGQFVPYGPSAEQR